MIIPSELSRTLWGIQFRAPIFNAAGIYKNGAGYAWCSSIGAGAYLAGTTTSLARKGNSRNSTYLPFAPYPQSHAASNWLGLPNEGHAKTAKILSSIPRVAGCPIGVSVALDPLASFETAVTGLAEGLSQYQSAGVDFIELNESCPNTEENSNIAHSATMDELFMRLDEVSKNFLKKRNRSLPVIVKFTNDTNSESVPYLIDTLIALGYDGVNFGNTSTDYACCKSAILKSEQKIYDYFTGTFGGGISGRPLASRSLMLTKTAAAALEAKPSRHEFHIIRTGGIETAADISESLKAGASLTEWFTGYFENFSKYGEKVYLRICQELLELL